MQDLTMTFSSDPATGVLLVSLPLTAQSQYATVSGPARMVQRVVRFILTPQGSLPYDPTYGNELFDFLGTAAARDATAWITWLKNVEYAMLQRQTQDIQAGNLAQDETIAAFANEQASFPTPFIVALGLTVISQAGAAHTLPAPIYLGLST